MRRRIVRLSLFTVLIALLAVPLAGAAVRLAGGTQGDKLSSKGRIDNRSNPLKAQQQRLLKKALEQRLSGKTHAKAVEVARGQYVQLAREGEYSIWTLPGEFADLAHNQIPEPDRSVDNSTIWRPDFNRAYYMDMLFNSTPGANSMRNFYIEQSSGRFAVSGDVSDWVPVPGNGAAYDDDLGGPEVWQFLIDSTSAWYEEQLATRTPAEVDAWLSQFDKRDRYDFDGDGDFNEPDGYIDTFQSVHAGLGNEDGGGVLGDSAIWSHSWYAWYQRIGSVGPEIDGQPNLAGGIQVGDSQYWIGDYTIQPENGGVGVFAHEYGHDLGLPDLYDTEGANDNAECFWTLMSDGSNISDGTVDIGSKPSHMGVWEKFQLGWLNYQVAFAGKTKDLKLGPAETNTKQAQGLFVVLPEKSVTSNIGSAAAGANFYYSGAGNNLDNRMYKSFTLPANATLTAKVRYDIELDWDYAYLVVSTNGGATWAGVPTSLSTATSPNGQNLGNGITGTTGGAWVDLTADLSAYSGDVLLGFRYWTDGAVAPIGFCVDEISVAGGAPDGAETDAGWTYAPAPGGFRVSTGTESALYSHYYVAEFRQYRGFDTTLKVGPYFFGYANDAALGNKVDHFPYQDGLLISYWDTSQIDNDVSVHPGHGLLLAVDAHPKALERVDGQIWRGRIQTYDSTFGFERTDALSLHVNSVLSPVASQPAVPVFNDTLSYYDPTNPFGSVITPTTNTTIRVVSYSALGNFLQVQVTRVK